MSVVINLDKRELQGGSSNKSPPSGSPSSDDIDSLSDIGSGLPLRDGRRGGKAMISAFLALLYTVDEHSQYAEEHSAVCFAYYHCTIKTILRYISYI